MLYSQVFGTMSSEFHGIGILPIFNEFHVISRIYLKFVALQPSKISDDLYS